MWTAFRKNFITGLLLLMPLALTCMIFGFVVQQINNAFLEPFTQLIEQFSPNAEYVHFLKILIFVVLIFFIAFLGMLARNIFARRFFRSLESILLQLPVVDKIYKGIKEIRDAFMRTHHALFLKVVMVQYPRAGMYTLGFITLQIEGQIKEKLQKENCSAVFLPTVPNPTTGVIVFVPNEEIIPVSMTVEEGIKFIISAGMTARQEAQSPAAQES